METWVLPASSTTSSPLTYRGPEVTPQASGPPPIPLWLKKEVNIKPFSLPSACLLPKLGTAPSRKPS